MKLRRAHLRILIVSSLGQFLNQGLATLVGIVIPLMQLSLRTPLSSGLQGLLGCMSLIGIMFGSAIIGSLSNRYGYLLPFRLCPAVCGVAAAAVIVFPLPMVLYPALFVMGFAIGGEFCLDPDYISELMPDRWKTFMVGVSKSFSAVGSAFVALCCYVVLTCHITPRVWPSLMWIIVGICLAMVLLRLRFSESPSWLAARGRTAQAAQAARNLLGSDVTMPPTAPDSGSASDDATADVSAFRFIATHLRQVVLTGVPWACEGLGIYGIGIFLPMLIMALGIDLSAPDATPVERIAHSVMLTFGLCVVMMIGFVAGLIIGRKHNHFKIQTVGFIVSAAGLVLLLLAYTLHWPKPIALAGLIIFELAINGGPNLIAYVLPSQIFSVADRSISGGIAASIGKTGAIAGAFCIPVILHTFGAPGVLLLSIAVMLLGALITATLTPKA